MDNSENSGLTAESPQTDSKHMIRCPKCHFEQPGDQYCAKCGIDMSRYHAPTPPLYARPLFFGVVSIAIFGGIIGAFIAKRNSAGEPGSLQAKIKNRALRIEAQKHQNYDSSPRRDEATTPADASLAAQESDTLKTNSLVSAVEVSAPSDASVSQAVGDSTRPLDEGNRAGSAASAKPTPQLNSATVSAAWAEASSEWLNALGAAADGSPTRIQNLETKLKEARGAYRIIVSQKLGLDGNLNSQATPTVVRRPDNGDAFSLNFSTDGSSQWAGALDFQTRRGPAGHSEAHSTSFDLTQGTGSILRTNQPGTAPGTETIIVLLIRSTPAKPQN